MDCEKRPPPSVIEMLMGFDTQPIQQPIKKRQRKRVISDNYLQKTASLHFSQRRLPSRTCSSVMQVDVHADLRNLTILPTMTYMDQSCKADYQICWSDSMFTSCLQDLQDASSHTHHLRGIKTLNPPKFEDGLQTKICEDAMKLQKKRKHIHFTPSKGRFSIEYNGPEKEKLCLFPSEIVNYKLDGPKNSGASISSLSGSWTRKRADLRSLVRGNWIKTHRSLIRPRAHCDTNWYLIDEEANRSTPSKARLHITKCNGSSVPCESGLVCTNHNSSFSMVQENECVKESGSNESKIRRCNGKNVFDESNGIYELLHGPSSSVDSGRLKDCKMSLANQTPAFDSSLNVDYVSASMAINPMALATQTEDTSGSGATQIECLICAADDIYQEASHSLSDDSLASCQTPEPLSPTSSEEISRCSPISVLKSLSKERVPSTMVCSLNGSPRLYEVYSEGPGMTVSSDEDNREETKDTIEDNIELSDSSYLGSVLDGAFGHGDVNYTLCFSLENPVDILVFQILEKKYGRQVSWPRSERKILFDRINLGLKAMAKSCIGIQQISTPVIQRLSAGWTRKEIEEKLWRLIIIQEKEATKAKDISPLKDKNLTAMKGKKSNAIMCKGVKASASDFSFFELEDYMDEIIIDIEDSLLDGLVSECVNEESF